MLPSDHEIAGLNAAARTVELAKFTATQLSVGNPAAPTPAKYCQKFHSSEFYCADRQLSGCLVKKTPHKSNAISSLHFIWYCHGSLLQEPWKKNAPKGLRRRRDIYTNDVVGQEPLWAYCAQVRRQLPVPRLGTRNHNLSCWVGSFDHLLLEPVWIISKMHCLFRRF